MTGSRVRGPIRARLGILALLTPFPAALAGGASPAALAGAAPLEASAPRPTVVLIPGFTGSELRERETGRVLWGRARSVFFPRDGGYTVAIPLDADFRDQQPLEAPRAVTRIQVPLMYRLDVYGSLIETLESHGYVLGDLEHPRADEDLYVFSHDFRWTSVDIARQLAARLQRLRRIRGAEPLRVSLICHSNAARIARYLVKYGDATLEQAETAPATPLAGVRVEKLILVAPDNGGSVRTVELFNGGSSYFPLVGRRFLPEVIFTFRVAYESLPAYRDDLFLDAEGRALEVDLFDAETWRRYGWSIFGRAARERLRGTPRADLFGDADRRVEFLHEMLDRSRRLHRLLKTDVEGFAGTRYYWIQNRDRDTPHRLVLLQEKGRWKVLDSTHRGVRSNPALRALADAPGDGYATVEGQEWISPQEVRAMAAPPVLIPAYHRNLVSSRTAHRRILEFLSECPPRRAVAGPPARALTSCASGRE